MHDHFWNHAREEELEQTQRKAEAGPVVAIFHHIQAVALEINFLVKVHLMECLHWYAVLPIVFDAIALAAEMQIVLDGLARISGLLILAGRDGGSQSPKNYEDW